MKSTKNIFQILLIITIVLILIDIAIRCFFGFNFQLFFESAYFNNIVTPIATCIAVYIYTMALFNSVKQNKILLSQTIKPYFEKEIERLIKESDEIIIRTVLIKNKIMKDKIINVKNYIDLINDICIELSKNEDFKNDFNDFEKGILYKKNHFEERSYYSEVLFLNQFVSEIGVIPFFYDKIKILIEEINISKLIEEDKILIKNSIKRTFLAEYFSFIKFLDSHPPFFMPPIPCIMSSSNNNIEFKNFNHTPFRNHYDLLLRII
jgi:hypothetical protein